MIKNEALIDPRLGDISLTPQGGYFAGMCLKQVSNDHDPFYDPTLRAENDAFTDMLMQGGINFESEIGENLKSQFAADAKMVFIPSCTRTKKSKKAREVATVAAMADGAIFIWNARLPADSKRISEPDWLERIGETPKANGKWAYAPGDVKHSLTIKGDSKSQVWQMAPLNASGIETAVASEEAGKGLPVPKHSIQLAHYHMHLTSLGYAQETDQLWGAIYGKEGVRIYRNLNEALYMHHDNSTDSRRRMSAIEIYNQEFDLRILIAKAAKLRGSDQDLKSPVGPEICGPSCTCPWRDVSKDELREMDSIILLQGITYKIAQPLYAVGITTVAQLARLDYKTASLMSVDVDLALLISSAKFAKKNAPIRTLLTASVVGKIRPDAVKKAALKAERELKVLGFKTATDLLTLNKKTLSVLGTKKLARLIDQARVTKTGKVARDRGVKFLRMPTGAVQIDIDMENDGLIYLWGTRTTITTSRGTKSTYKPFVSWDRSDEGEAQAFVQFWDYLMKTQAWAKSRHIGTVNFFYYTAAENRCMRALAKKHSGVVGIPTLEQVDALISSNNWVDMFTVIKTQTLWPTADMGLKSVAKWIRFSWRETGANGAESINWYRDATSEESTEEEQLALRSRILEYNDDDVTATLELRKWLSRLGVGRKAGVRLISVADLEPKFRNNRTIAGITAAELDKETTSVTPSKKAINVLMPSRKFTSLVA